METKHEEPYFIVPARNQTLPIIVSVPHSGVAFPTHLIHEFHPKFLDCPEDTDWFVHHLYDFAPDLGITLIHARFSRYVIDLNRNPENKKLYDDKRRETALMPTFSFAGEPLYRQAAPDQREHDERIEKYYWPYYKKITGLLSELQRSFKNVLFFDAHSIVRNVPSISPKPFPDLILGNRERTSAHETLIDAALGALTNSKRFGVSHNAPFKGGHLTQYFGQPAQGVHALQLEMSQDLYMDRSALRYDEKKAAVVRDTLKAMFGSLRASLEIMNR